CHLRIGLAIRIHALGSHLPEDRDGAAVAVVAIAATVASHGAPPSGEPPAPTGRGGLFLAGQATRCRRRPPSISAGVECRRTRLLSQLAAPTASQMTRNARLASSPAAA